MTIISKYLIIFFFFNSITLMNFQLQKKKKNHMEVYFNLIFFLLLIQEEQRAFFISLFLFCESEFFFCLRLNSVDPANWLFFSLSWSSKCIRGLCMLHLINESCIVFSQKFYQFFFSFFIWIFILFCRGLVFSICTRIELQRSIYKFFCSR